ncbi:hypothetical protein [Streptomyces sp. NRRL F-5727]|uniref:hypothetical protein n=1 Tax=Streptomyces sp. NRRL F-5727 TaxID=1463871 RepID=UPI00131AEE8C|nr:hypothetical protein [Streptomyces sp. NRRL F-5727]
MRAQAVPGEAGEATVERNGTGRPDDERPWDRARAGGGPAQPPDLPPYPPGGVPMPPPVRGLRTLLMVLAGLQALLAVWVLTHSAEIAARMWEDDAPELHSGTVEFYGVLFMAVAGWGVATAVRFPTRLPGVRISALAYGWVSLPFGYLVFGVSIFAIAWTGLTILALVRPNQPESRAWFR